MMRRQRERRFKKDDNEDKLANWVPKTTLGRMVMAGEISDIEQIYEKNMAILEPEVVDKLLPTLQEEVLDIKMVQRTTDSGRKGSFICSRDYPCELHIY